MRREVSNGGPRQQFGAYGQRLLMDVGRRAVMRSGRASLGCGSDKGKAPGDTLEKESHVFATHGAYAVPPITRSHQLGGDVAHQGAHAFIVDQRRAQAAVVHLRFGPESRRDPLRGLGDEAWRLIPEAAPEGTHRAA